MESITKKEIIDYLLNKLDEKTEENFLVKCFSNDKNTEKFNIVREDLIESYLSGNLSKESKLLFETHFLAESHHQELFQFSKNFRNQLLQNKELATVALVNSEKKFFSFGKILIPIGALATIIIGVIAIWQQGKIIELVGLKPTPTVTPTPIKTPINIVNPTVTPSPEVTSSPKTSLSPTPSNSLQTTPIASPTPQITVTPTQKETPKPTPIVKENPILAFTLPLISKGGNDNALKISKQRKTIILQTSKPYKEFPKYEVTIETNNNTIFTQEFEKDKLIDTNGKINLSIQAEIFKSGETIFKIKGKNEDGTFEELKGSERKIKVRKE